MKKTYIVLSSLMLVFYYIPLIYCNELIPIGYINKFDSKNVSPQYILELEKIEQDLKKTLEEQYIKEQEERERREKHKESILSKLNSLDDLVNRMVTASGMYGEFKTFAKKKQPIIDQYWDEYNEINDNTNLNSLEQKIENTQSEVVNKQSNSGLLLWGKETILHWGGMYADCEMVKLALDNGADLDKKNKNGRTPCRETQNAHKGNVACYYNGYDTIGNILCRGNYRENYYPSPGGNHFL